MQRASFRVAAIVIAASSLAVGCNGSTTPSDTGADDVSMTSDASDVREDSTMVDDAPADDPVVADTVTDIAFDSPIGTDPLPPFDAATEAHVRDQIAMGRARGNNVEVFAKIGDSISESASFLFDCGYGWIRLGDHAEVGPTIDYFRQVQLGDRNSLNRASECAVAGWSSAQALENYPDSALNHELNDTHPMFALVMYGTNDLERYDVGTYAANINRIVDIIEANGTVAALSTIPPRLDNADFNVLVGTFNDAIRSIASTRHLPLVDFWVALQGIPNNGISSDGVHPDIYLDPSDPNTDGCDFSAPALEHGYNVRNLTALAMLGRLRTYAN